MTLRISQAAVAADAEALCAIHDRVTQLVPSQHARAEHAAALRREVVTPLGEALTQAIAISRRLEDACDEGDPETGEWGDHLEDTEVGARPLVDRSVAGTLADQLWQQVGNLAFAARSELRRAERYLHAADDHDQLVVASESARRKLRRAIEALLDVTGQALGQTFLLTGIAGEIEAAIAVRRLYGKFRRSLPTCDADDSTQVRRALRLSAVALAVMVGSADFGEIRAHDRQLLLRLQGRIVEWARDGASAETGRQLYLDLHAAADLLRTIERRQELVANDQAVLGRLAALLGADGSDRADLVQLGPLLHALGGKDDEIDAIAAAASMGQDASVRARLRARLAELGWIPPAIAA